MDLTNINIEALIADLDGQRMKMKMSYQAVADACGVSQMTIIRALKKQSTPTMELLQQIANAVKYEPSHEPVILEDYTKDAYIEYLRSRLIEEKMDTRSHLAQLEAHYNMLLAQKSRTITILSIVLLLVSIFLVSWLIMEILHPNQGWIHYESAIRWLPGIFRS